LRKKGFLIPFLISILVCLSLSGVVEAPPSIATVAQEPVWTYEPVCTEFTINLTITDAYDIQGWDANITFDPTILEVVNASEGEFIKSGAPLGITFFDKYINNETGYIYLGCSYYYVMGPGYGVTGNGTLANVTFHVKSDAGATLIHFKEDTTLWYHNGTALDTAPRVLHDGLFTILGDLNCNGDVGCYDLYLLARAYNSSAGDPGYNYLADLDDDDNVDSDDLNLYNENYGKTVGS